VRIAVTTPTGNIGSVVADRLLAGGAEVVLLVRDPKKVAPLVERGATAIPGGLNDAEYVKEATRGVDALFWLTPPDYTAADFRGVQNRLGENAAAAVRANGIARVVNLSSVGAQLDSGTGPIRGLRDVEEKLDAVAENVTHLRPNMFMENTLGSVPTIAGQRSIFLPVGGSAAADVIATRDIGKAAAERLLDAGWSGRAVLELFGPAPVTFDEQARVLSEALGEAVAHVPVPPEAAVAALTGLGLSPSAAAGVVEIYQAVDSGHLRPVEPPTPEKRTSTTFEEFARTVLVPAIRGAGAPAS
jgi:uncharacterized protein YbjT (DUF2867 family)